MTDTLGPEEPEQPEWQRELDAIRAEWARFAERFGRDRGIAPPRWRQMADSELTARAVSDEHLAVAAMWEMVRRLWLAAHPA